VELQVALIPRGQPLPVVLFARLFGGKFNGKRLAIDPEQSMVEFATRPTTCRGTFYENDIAQPPSTLSYRRLMYFRHVIDWTFPGPLGNGVHKKVVWYANTGDTEKARALLLKWMFRGSNELSAPAAQR
jgi:hypothetical protein